MDIIPNKIKKLYIKLGSDCNLHCKYCHSAYKKIGFNPDILPVLKSMNLRHVTLGGGEPLLYWNIIKKIIEYLGNMPTYRIVTNGTLLTQEIVDFCNAYHVRFGISVDGINSTRDKSKNIQWDLISKLQTVGIATTIYNENQNIKETLASLTQYKKQYTFLDPDIWSSFPNFVHSTKDTGILSSHEFAISYINQMIEMIDEALILFKKGNYTPFLRRCFEIYCKGEPGIGVRCCSESNICMLANGDICSCPYTLDKVGDIFHFTELDFKKIQDKYMRPACKTCDIFSICKNFCCANITEDECYVMKQMHSNMKTLMKQHSVSYKELNEDFTI